MAINSCVLMGRLTRDPEKRYTADNTPVTSFSIAVNRDKDRSDFFDCTAWRKTADFVSTYFAKGDMIQHKAFGRGMVLTVLPMGNDALLEIAFDGVGTKRLMANTASQHMKKL